MGNDVGDSAINDCEKTVLSAENGEAVNFSIAQLCNYERRCRIAAIATVSRRGCTYLYV